MSDDRAATDGERTPPPGLDESLRQVGHTGKAAFDSAKDTGRALRRLVSADFTLMRSAFGRGLAWAGVAIVFGASAWALLAGSLIALLVGFFGWSWLGALSLAALISIVVTVFAAWKVGCYFDYTGMHATRRQLHRLGLFDEDDDANDDDKTERPK